MELSTGLGRKYGYPHRSCMRVDRWVSGSLLQPSTWSRVGGTSGNCRSTATVTGSPGRHELDTLRRLASGEKIRLGIMGGTFDPMHMGHLAAADGAYCALELGEVLFVPTGSAPHKPETIAPSELRYQMVVAATVPHPHFSVTRIEVDRTGVDYTVDTLTYLAGQLPSGTELFFIVGADSLPDLHTWKDPVGILELCRLVVVHRPGHDSARMREILEPFGGEEKAVRVDIPGLEISSTDIRRRVGEGQGVRYLVPDSVYSLIEKTGIYGGPRLKPNVGVGDEG